MLIPQQAGGRRLDEALRLLVPGIGRRRAQYLIRTGSVHVDGRARPKGYRVCAGQEVSLQTQGPQAEVGDEILLGKVRVVHANRDYAALSKPGGLHTQVQLSSPEPGLEQVLPGLFPDCDPVLLNRLDQATSGLLLVGLHSRAVQVYTRLQEDGQIRKTYLVVVHGRVKTHTVVRTALNTAKRRKVQALPDTDPDPLRWTTVWPLAFSSGFQTSLLQVTIHKGRRHQIRAHLAFLGHPVLGDAMYGSKRTGELFLHHWKIRFSGFEAELAPGWAGWEQQDAGKFPNTREWADVLDHVLRQQEGKNTDQCLP